MPFCATPSKAGGSSPRVRGTRLGDGLRTRPNRFIPACAGNSQPLRRSSLGAGGSSPRVRGTPAVVSGEASGQPGSSPRVRGTPHTSLSATGRQRFIPACAGNSRRRAHGGTGLKVHPRVCGELLRKSLRRSAVDRFIPACAGNSKSRGRQRRINSGSSPRVRGTPSTRWRGAVASRFIPACAGNSSTRATSWTSPTVHPRVCGNSRWPTRKARTPAVHPRVCGELRQPHRSA